MLNIISCVIIKLKNKNEMILLLVSVIFLTNCTTKKYVYNEKTEFKERGIIVYKDPEIKNVYTIVPYVSVLGLGVGGTYLAGEFAYNNQIEQGKTIEESKELKQSVWVGGGLLTGYALYYLYNSSSSNKDEKVKNLNLQEANEWYANQSFSKDYYFFGLYNNSIFTIDYIKKDLIYVNSHEDLMFMKKVTQNTNNFEYFDKIVNNSFSKIPKSEHLKVFQETNGKYTQYIESYMQTIDTMSLSEIKNLFSSIKKLSIADSSKYLEKISEYAYSKTINSLLPVIDSTIVYRNVCNSLSQMVDKLINKGVKAEKEYSDEIVNNINSFDRYYENIEKNIKINQEMLENLNNYNLNNNHRNEINKLNETHKGILNKIKEIKTELLKNISLLQNYIKKVEAEQYKIKMKEMREEKMKIVAKLSSGDCVLIGKNDYFSDEGALMVEFLKLGDKNFGGENFGKRIYWYQAKVVKNSDRIGFKIELYKGQWDDNYKWNVGEVISVDKVDIVKLCF